MFSKNLFFSLLTSLIFTLALTTVSMAQSKGNNEVLTDDALKRIVPTSFYFAGQSAETQMRNTAAAQLAKDRFVIVGLVDTSGYSTDISGKYEGFFITDSPVKIGGKMLGTGAYGFGFAKDKVNFFDLSSKQILSVTTMNDAEMKRPRPLLMTGEANGVRFYKGKSYVLISAK